MKKVCHLTSVHLETDIRILVKQCSSLAKSGYETYFVGPFETDKVVNGVNIIGACSREGNRLARMTSIVRKVCDRAIALKADVYHLHDPELLQIALKLQKIGAKVIYDSHEDLPRQIEGKYYIPSLIRKPLAFFIEKYENSVASKLDYIITATEHIKNRFVKINKHTIDINNYPILEELGEPDTFDKKEKAVVYAGGINEIRGIREIINAVPKFSGKLILGGTFSPASLKNQIEKLEGWNQVDYLGFVSREKVVEAYNRAMCGLVIFHAVPNNMEGLPNKLFEYMASGIPVICSRFDNWVKIIEDNKAGICVDPMNSNEIAEAVNYCLNNPEKSQEMGVNGRAIVVGKCNWALEEQKLLATYNLLLN
jgi:glycosyltransferase involved in cell wall biosynthesis